MKRRSVISITLLVICAMVLCARAYKIIEEKKWTLEGQLNFSHFTKSSCISIEEPLSVQKINIGPEITPIESVLDSDKIYFLGEELDGKKALYHMNLETNEFYEYDTDENNSDEFVWKNLQYINDLLIWDQFIHNDDVISNGRLCADTQGNSRTAPFRYGNIMFWKDSYYKFDGKKYKTSLLKMDNANETIVVKKEIYSPYEETRIFDGCLAYRDGSGEWVKRIALDTEKVLDKLIVSGPSKPNIVQCNRDYLLCQDYDKNLFVYFYNTNVTYYLKTLSKGITEAKTVLHHNGIWIIQEDEIVHITLPELYTSSIKLNRAIYDDYYVSNDGKLIITDSEERQVIIVSYPEIS